MVKVTELMGTIPEGNGAKTTSLRTLRLLHKVFNPIIYSGLYDVRSALRVNMVSDLRRFFASHDFLAKTHQVLLDQERRRIYQYQQAIWKVSTVLLQLPRLSPEALQWIEAEEAREQGDTRPFWRFVEKQLGRPPDDLLRKVLERHYLPYGGHIPYPVILALLGHHKERLETPNQKEWYTSKLAARVERQLNKNVEHNLMRSLESYGASKAARLEGLRENLPSVLIEVEADGYFFTEGRFRNELLGEVERLVVAENRLLRQTRKREKDEEGNELYKIVSLTSFTIEAEIFEDEFDPYAGIEDTLLLESLIASSGLTKSESEVLSLVRRGWIPEHIASQRGVTREAVDTHLSNIRKKLRSVS
jgi:DNA-binding CsgD family transcriptional regulator